MKKFISLLGLLVVAAAPVSAREVLRQNFDDATVFAAGPLRSGGAWTVKPAEPDDFTITSEEKFSPPCAFKVHRKTRAGWAVLSLPLADGHDFAFEFKLRCTTGNGIVLQFKERDSDKVAAGVLLQAGARPSGYTAEMRWRGDGTLPELPADAWFTCRIRFDVCERVYMLEIVTPDGCEHRGEIPYPLAGNGVCDRVYFINILPIDCQSFIDDVIVTQSESPAVGSRKSLDGAASSPDAELAAVLAGRSESVYAAKPGTSAVVEFAPEADVGGLVLQSSGALPQISVTALNQMGHTLDLGKNLTPSASGFYLLPPTQKVRKIQLDFAAPAVLTACRFYSLPHAGQGQLDQEFAAKVDAEYRLPVYDLQYPGHARAQLTFVNHTRGEVPVRVTLTERGSQQPWGEALELNLPVGKSDHFFELKDLPNGEYLTTIADHSDPEAEIHGKIERLLRLRTSPACSAAPLKELTGQKIFFPDAFYLAEAKQVEFIPGVAEKHPAVRGVPGEDEHWVHMADDIFLDQDGHICINYHTLDRQWHLASRQAYHAVALDDTLEHWESLPGLAAIPPQHRPMDSCLPAPAVPDWEPKPGVDGKITYRFYDAEADGPVRLDQVNLEVVNGAAPGTVGYQKYDWQVMRPAPWTIWPIWYKAPGEALILSRTPLVDAPPPTGVLESPNSGSDLLFGRWLSDDGKTLFVGHGRHLIRHAPYTARYDNLYDRARIVAVWRTRDGINWEQNYVAPPDANKPPADQSYGGHNFRVPDGSGLRIAFFNRYSAYYQQISWELIYSWDGFRWTRFQDRPQFLPNGPLGDFFHGGGYVGGNAIEKDGKIYQLMGWVNDHYHFQSEIVHTYSPTAKGLTAEFLRRNYAPRHLEEWPYFQKHFDGSYEKLAEHTQKATSGFGVMVYRKDGYFAATAGNTPAHLVTVPLTAQGGLKINAAVDKDGYLEIKLLQNGRAVFGYARRFTDVDAVALPVFDRLPAGEFQVEIIMQNARLYTLEF